MLADQFAEMKKIVRQLALPDSDELSLINGTLALGERVKEAKRFVLDRRATMMTQNVANTSASFFTKVLNICRLPAPFVWVEFPFQDRTDWLREAAAAGQKFTELRQADAPRRMGFLLEEFEMNGRRFLLCHVAWSHNPISVDVAKKAFIMDMSEDHIGKGRAADYVTEIMSSPQRMKQEGAKTRADAERIAEMSERVVPIVPDYLEEYWRRMRLRGPLVIRELEDASTYDLASEWRFVLGLLMLINSRNIFKLGEEETYAGLNKKRTRSGKAALLSHRPIKLGLSKIQHNRIATGYAGPRARPGEPQFVIGHFKLRSSGLYWWSPHTRYGDNAKPRDHIVVG